MPYLVTAYEKGKKVKEFWDCLRDTPLATELLIDGLKGLFPNYEFRKKLLSIEDIHARLNEVEREEREKKNAGR